MKRPKDEKKRPSHTVFVVEGDGEKAFWIRIGAAWEHEDGEGFSLNLIALPLAGRMVVRKAVLDNGRA